MNKKTKFKLNETLDKALSPPKKTRNLKALDTLLHQFDDGKGITPNLVGQNLNLPTQTRPRPDPDQTQTDISKISDSKKKPTINRIVLQNKNISPVRDYNKRANSLERDALPAGLFPGASKSIYDALYLKTIGAIAPKKRIQATRKELMEWSGIKNIKTINAHLKRLKDIGLVKATNFVGEQKGAFYEIFLPEEINQPDPDQTQPRPDPDQTQKLVLDPDQKTVWVGLGKIIETKDTYSFAKTSLKTRDKNDDELPSIFSGFINEFENVCLKLTGKNLKITEREKWTDVAKLLVMELELAAARTELVSSVPAFLKEILRRKLEGKTTGQGRALKAVSNSLQVGKPDASDISAIQQWERESLSQDEREKTLAIMRERIMEGHRELVMSMEQSYTVEDWQWILENLASEKTEI